MKIPFDISLPFTDPVLIFSLVLFIILMAPALLKKLRIPSIIGLIVAGMLVGPNGFNLLLRDSSIVLFGTVGLLYIMFLAGLEIDLNDFRANKNRSLVFGLLTFTIPMALGTLVSFYFLGYNLLASLLLASMFASHTLLTYPIASRYGITKAQVVNVAVGGTIITDTAALLVLAIIAASVGGDLNMEFWVQLLISLSIFVTIVMWLIPIIARWFFKNVEGEGGPQFIFVLAVVFASAFLAQLAGVEPIIGAFFAGLSLNKLIPSASPLMNRIDFVGNNLFIPFFLISVGMLVDLRVIFMGVEALWVALTMVVVAIVAKWLAAYLTQKIYQYSADERNVIFGLSNSQAAATLAAVMVGYRLNIFDENVLNGTILMILVTCLVSSFVMENATRRFAIAESNKRSALAKVPQRILVPIGNPNNIAYLLDLAILIKTPGFSDPIYALSVVPDDKDVQENVTDTRKKLHKITETASASDMAIQIATRVDLNVANGILRAVKELAITEVVMGWSGKITTREKIFGSVLDNLLERSGRMILVSKIIQPLNLCKKIVVAIPANADLEIGFARWIYTIRVLSVQSGASILFCAPSNMLKGLEQQVKRFRPMVKAHYKEFESWEGFLVISREVKKDDLLVVISARKGTVSYNYYLDNVPQQLSKHFKENSFVIAYPEQKLA
jgi:Kef-type K+ transport system membrane component KefB